MYLFDSYPHGGKALLGRAVGSNCRHGYGLKFMRMTGQAKCAYCAMDFTSSYENWLQMALDHVVPKSVCKSFDLPQEWSEDCANKVLACFACNSFCNRYKPAPGTLCPKSLDEFFALRDKILSERRRLVQKKHAEEREFFNSKPWEKRFV
jgi:hypothetical protein